MYSTSYQVPVLYFNIFNAGAQGFLSSESTKTAYPASDGSALNSEQIWSLFEPMKSIGVDLSTLTQAVRPTLGG